MSKRLVRQKEAAEYLGLSEATLERDRWRGGDIPFVRVGPRSIRYSLDQLEEYVQSRTVGRMQNENLGVLPHARDGPTRCSSCRAQWCAERA